MKIYSYNYYLTINDYLPKVKWKLENIIETNPRLIFTNAHWAWAE